jgi:hypothetical protein
VEGTYKRSDSGRLGGIETRIREEGTGIGFLDWKILSLSLSLSLCRQFQDLEKNSANSRINGE